MRKKSTIILIWGVFLVFIAIIFRFCIPSNNSETKFTITKAKHTLNNLPKLNIPENSNINLLKVLEKNGYLKEETYVGMAEDRNNEVFNCTYNNTSIFVQTLSKPYYKDKITDVLNKEFYEDNIKYKMHNPNFDTGSEDAIDIEYYKKLNNNAVIHGFSDKDKYTHKTLNKREIVVKLAPDKILTFSAIRFSDYDLNKTEQKKYFYKHLIKFKSDIKTLNKIFQDIK